MSEILGSQERQEVVNELINIFGSYSEEVRNYLDEIFRTRDPEGEQTRVDRSIGYMMSLIRIKEHLLGDVKLFSLDTNDDIDLMKSKVSSSDYIVPFLDKVNTVKEEFIEKGAESILSGGYFESLLPELSSILDREIYELTQRESDFIEELAALFLGENHGLAEYDTYVILFRKMLNEFGENEQVNVNNLLLVFKRLMIFICNQNKNPIEMLFDPTSPFAEEDKFGRLEIYVRIVAYVLEIAGMVWSIY